MTDEDFESFGELMVGLGEVYGEPVSTLRVELSFRLLARLSIEEVRAAATAHAERSHFFPKPADLLELASGNTEDQAELAWSYLLREIKRVGLYGKPSWPDAKTEHAALALYGGWRRLCENLPAGGPELLGFHKQFCALYGAQARQDGLPSRDEATALLDEMRAQLKARKLPTGEK